MKGKYGMDYGLKGGLRQKARRAADELGLTYDYRFTGYGAFPDFVADAITASTSQTSQQKQRR